MERLRVLSMTNRNKLLLIIIPICVALLICIFLLVNYVLFSNLNDLNILTQTGINTNKLLSAEQNKELKGDIFKYTHIKSKEQLFYGIIPYGIKATCEYNDGDISFIFDVYEVRYTKTTIKDIDREIIGKNTNILLKDFYIVILDGTTDQLKRAFYDMGFALDGCSYINKEMTEWQYLETKTE